MKTSPIATVPQVRSTPQRLRIDFSENLYSPPTRHPPSQQSQAEQKLAIIDASRVGWGASGRNGRQ